MRRELSRPMGMPMHREGFERIGEEADAVVVGMGRGKGADIIQPGACHQMRADLRDDGDGFAGSAEVYRTRAAPDFARRGFETL
jgi:hypothetical protein